MTHTVEPGVVGPAGYGGFELAGLLLRHPRVKKPLLFAREGEAANPSQLDELYPHISGNGGYPLEPFNWETLAARGVDVLFLATPHEVSREWAPEALRRGVHVIDLSGAWRLASPLSLAVFECRDSDPDLVDLRTAHAGSGIPGV